MNLYFETQYQGELFFLAAAAGMLCALLMDIGATLLGKTLRPVADILAFLLATASVLGLSLFVGKQQPRFFLLLGTACGVTLYSLGLRRLLVAASLAVRRLVTCLQEGLQKKHTLRQENACGRRIIEKKH